MKKVNSTYKAYSSISKHVYLKYMMTSSKPPMKLPTTQTNIGGEIIASVPGFEAVEFETADDMAIVRSNMETGLTNVIEVSTNIARPKKPVSGKIKRSRGKQGDRVKSRRLTRSSALKHIPEEQEEEPDESSDEGESADVQTQEGSYAGNDEMDVATDSDGRVPIPAGYPGQGELAPKRMVDQIQTTFKQLMDLPLISLDSIYHLGTSLEPCQGKTIKIHVYEQILLHSLALTYSDFPDFGFSTAVYVVMYCCLERPDHDTLKLTEQYKGTYDSIVNNNLAYAGYFCGCFLIPTEIQSAEQLYSFVRSPKCGEIAALLRAEAHIIYKVFVFLLHVVERGVAGVAPLPEYLQYNLRVSDYIDVLATGKQKVQESSFNISPLTYSGPIIPHQPFVVQKGNRTTLDDKLREQEEKRAQDKLKLAQPPPSPLQQFIMSTPKPHTQLIDSALIDIESDQVMRDTTRFALQVDLLDELKKMVKNQAIEIESIRDTLQYVQTENAELKAKVAELSGSITSMTAYMSLMDLNKTREYNKTLFIDAPMTQVSSAPQISLDAFRANTIPSAQITHSVPRPITPTPPPVTAATVRALCTKLTTDFDKYDSAQLATEVGGVLRRAGRTELAKAISAIAIRDRPNRQRLVNILSQLCGPG